MQHLIAILQGITPLEFFNENPCLGLYSVAGTESVV